MLKWIRNMVGTEAWDYFGPVLLSFLIAYFVTRVSQASAVDFVLLFYGHRCLTILLAINAKLSE